MAKGQFCWHQGNAYRKKWILFLSRGDFSHYLSFLYNYRLSSFRSVILNENNTSLTVLDKCPSAGGDQPHVWSVLRLHDLCGLWHQLVTRRTVIHWRQCVYIEQLDLGLYLELQQVLLWIY